MAQLFKGRCAFGALLGFAAVVAWATYTGDDSCEGPFTGGTFVMTR